MSLDCGWRSHPHAVDARNAVFVRSPMVSAVGETRRTTRFIALAVLGASTAIAAAGCSLHDASPPSVTASATGTSTSSEQAILAAAIDAYTRYSAAFDVYLAALPADADPSGLRETVTADYWSVLQGEFSSSQRTWYQVGSTAFGDVELLSSRTDGRSVTASIVVCVDSAHVELLDSEGKVVHAADRALRFPMRIDLERSSTQQFRVNDAVTIEEEEKVCGD